MGDHDHGGIEVLLQLPHQLQDLGLDGNVQSCGRLVGDQQVRLADQSDGDTDALLHSAGKLEGILIFPFSGDAHQPQDLVRPLGALLLTHVFEVQLKHFTDLVAHGNDGVQAGHGVLENHGDLLAAHGTQLPLVHGADVLAAIHHRAAGDLPNLFRENIQNAQGGGGFSGAGLTYQPHGLALVDHQIHSVDGVNGGVVRVVLDVKVRDIQ